MNSIIHMFLDKWIIFLDLKITRKLQSILFRSESFDPVTKACCWACFKGSNMSCLLKFIFMNQLQKLKSKSSFFDRNELVLH